MTAWRVQGKPHVYLYTLNTRVDLCLSHSIFIKLSSPRLQSSYVASIRSPLASFLVTNSLYLCPIFPPRLSILPCRYAAFSSSKLHTFPLNFTHNFPENWFLHHFLLPDLLTPWSTIIFQKLFYNCCILWTLKVHYRVHNGLLLVPVRKQPTPVHALSLYFCKLQFHSFLISLFEVNKVYSSSGQ
jgi:hypothetical protein